MVVQEGAHEALREARNEMTTENPPDLSTMYEGESGRVLTREHILRAGMRGADFTSTDTGYMLNGEHYTPVADEERTDDGW